MRHWKARWPDIGGSYTQPSATHAAKKTHPVVHPCLPGTPPADNARTHPLHIGMVYQTCDGRSPGLYPASPGLWPVRGTAPYLPAPGWGTVAYPRTAFGRNVIGTYSCGGSDGFAPIFPFHPGQGAPSSPGMMHTKPGRFKTYGHAAAPTGMHKPPNPALRNMEHD